MHCIPTIKIIQERNGKKVCKVCYWNKYLRAVECRGSICERILDDARDVVDEGSWVKQKWGVGEKVDKS